MHAATITDSFNSIQSINTAFNILSVCRQIYAESSHLFYTLYIFEIDCKRVADLPSHEFLFGLNPDQREGIRVVEITARPLLWYLYDMATTSVKDIFPGLKGLVLGRRVAEDVLRFAVKAGEFEDVGALVRVHEEEGVEVNIE
jgi:hypothetical protein